MAIRTLSDVFFTVVDRDSDCVYQQKQNESWVPSGSRQLYSQVVSTARTLQGWGVQKGDRVAILSENRPEWAIADFATMLIGGIVVPIYPTLTAEQISWLLNDAGVKVLFLSSVEQLKKFQEIQRHSPVVKVVIMDDAGDRDAVSMRSILQSSPAGRDSAFDNAAHALAPDDIATIIYTSGTTGQQKGAILSHGNLAANISVSMDGYPVNIGDEWYVSFLPLSHVTARHVDYAMYYRGIRIAYQPDINKLLDTLQEIRPTIFVGIPRVYEKIRLNVQHKTAKGLKNKIYNWAMKVGRENRETILKGDRKSVV